MASSEDRIAEQARWVHELLCRARSRRDSNASVETTIFDPSEQHSPVVSRSASPIEHTEGDEEVKALGSSATLAGDLEQPENIERLLAPKAVRPLPPQPEESEEREAMAANSNAFPPLENSMNTPNRSPTASPSSQVNGNGGSYTSSYIPPLPVGHQQDLAYLYQQIQELSGILESNREKVNDVTKSAEEVARRANLANGHDGGDSAADKARIRELEREVAKANKMIELYKHEQRENTSLIGEYEQGVWQMTDQVRDYAGKTEERMLALKRHYNDLLQQEKDEHLETRLDRDRWHANTIRCGEMLRQCYRARVDEWCDEYRVIVGLQSEVRCLRRCLGIEAEKPEEETGWPYLKDAPFDDQA